MNQNAFLARIRRLGFAVVFVAVFSAAVSLSAAERAFALVLEGAIDAGPAKGALPVHLYLHHDGESFSAARAISYYWPTANDSTSGGGTLFGNWEPSTPDISALSLAGDALEGTVSVAIGQTILTTTLSAHILDNDRVVGAHGGSVGDSTPRRGLEGEVLHPSSEEGNGRASIYLRYGVAPGFQQNPARRSVAVHLVFSEGVATAATATIGSFDGTSVSIGREVPLTTPNGTQGRGFTSNTEDTMEVISHDLTWSNGSIAGELVIEFFNRGESVGAFTYSLEGEVIARRFAGLYAVDTAAGDRIRSDVRAIGVAGPAAPVSLPPITPLQSLPSPGGAGFQPPYFEEISQADFRQRLEAAALWLYTAPYHGAIHSDHTAAHMRNSGTKNYDGGSEVAYGGAMAMITLARLTEDPSKKAAALRSAQRAAYRSQMQGVGPYNLNTTYKGMFFTTVFQGLAYLELFLETGDIEWREQARHYAWALEHLQGRMFHRTEGTWTYYGADWDYPMGVSNSRNDRSRDWLPIQAGEMLYFLGKLRVEGGVDEFRQAEDLAHAWMIENLDTAWTVFNRRGMGPTQFLLYLLRYADEPDDAVIDQVVAHVEGSYTSWSRSASFFSPGVGTDLDRLQGGGTIAEISSTLRMALVYLHLYRERGEAVWLEKAKTFVHSVLNRQNTWGFIHPAGLRTAEDNVQARGAFHQYTALSAEGVRLLLEAYHELAALSAFPGENVSAVLNADVLSGTAPLTVHFDATDSSGSAGELGFHWDFDDGATSAAIAPAHTFTHPGTYRVRLTVAGDTARATRHATIRVHSEPVLTSIRLRPEPYEAITDDESPFENIRYVGRGKTLDYTARAYDQYGIPMEVQPVFTWSASDGNSVDAAGRVTVAEETGPFSGPHRFTVTAQAGGRAASADFRVLAPTGPDRRHFSISFTGRNFHIDRTHYVAGVLQLDRWTSFERRTWGGWSSFNVQFTDDAGEETLRMHNNGSTGADVSSLPILNADVLMASGRVRIHTDHPIIVSEIPDSFRETGYHVYIYSHADNANAHSVTFDDGSGPVTRWLRGTTDPWDGMSFHEATAETQGDALAGGFTNYVLFENLKVETFSILASFGVSGIQIIQARMDEGPLAFASRAVDGAAVGVPYSYAVQLRGGDAETLVLSAVDLPDWLELMPDPEDPRRGTLFGTPAEADEGPHAILLAAADVDGEVSQAFTLTVFPEGFALEAPMILPLAPAVIGLNAATLRANLTRGKDPVQVRLLRGTFDGGDSPMAWQFISSPVVHGLGELEWELEGLQPGTTYYYRFSAQNAYGLVFTQTQSFTTEVLSARIVQQPTNAESFPGGQAQFTVIAAGVEPITYQWRKDGVDLADGPRVSGANNSVLILSDLTAQDAGSYTVFVSNNDGSDLSEPATLTLIDPVPPVITTQPVGGTFEAGATVELFVEVESLAPVAFQWRRDGVPLSEGGGISGVDTATLRVSSFGPEDEGLYDVVVSSVGGSTVSDPASLFLLPSMDAVLAEWNFNHFPESTTTEGFEETIAADVGTGVLYLRSSSSTGTNFRRSTGGGTEINAWDGTPAGGAIELRRGARWNNGLVEFRFDMTGFEAALVSFAYRTSDSQPSMAVVEWSADGGESYTEHTVLASADYEGGFAVVWLDLTEATALNNAADARVRLRYNADGGSTNAGSGAIFDNVRVEARRSAVGYAGWRAARFGDTEHPDGEPRADPWQRGIPNILDYVLGLDHLESPHSGLPRSGVGTLHFTRRADAEFLLVVEESHGLAPDDWEIIAFLEPGANGWTTVGERADITEEADGPFHRVTVISTPAADSVAARFWRVTVEAP